MNELNLKHLKKSALMFFLASALFSVTLILSFRDETPNYLISLPAIPTFLTGVVQWRSYKRLKQKMDN